MKTILVVVVLLLVGIAGIAGLGFYQGWFRLSSDSSEQQPNATFTVDKDKIHAELRWQSETFYHRAIALSIVGYHFRRIAQSL